MQKPEWTKIGNGPVEVCVGTDGVAGVSFDGKVVFAVSKKTGLGWDSKEHFEDNHCQPPAQRHIRDDYADGSVVIKSVEKDEQGRPLRVAFVRRGPYCDMREARVWGASWNAGYHWFGVDDKQAAIDRAIRYVEMGE